MPQTQFNAVPSRHHLWRLAAPALAWIVALAATAGPAAAWNHTGHRTTALMAWRELTPAARAAATRILKAHPRYDRDLLGDMPAGYPDPDQWAFMTAAVWPDLVRDRRHPMSGTHHKPTWHYVDYAYAPDGDRRGYQDGAAAWVPGTEPTNALQALALVEADLWGGASPSPDRAVALCWYLHLVGDLHQPLHASSLVNADFPKGDRGGNDELVRQHGAVTNLHSVWDGLLGRHVDPARFARAGDALADNYPRSAFDPGEASPVDPERVAAESRVLAARFVHLGGALRYAVAPPQGSPPVPAEGVPALPPGYEAAAAGVARRRVAQAGYRMGDELNRGLDPAAATRPATAPAATRPATQPAGELLTPTP